MTPAPSTAPPAGLPPAALGSRALFPALQTPFYLNHAGVSPASARVAAAVTAMVEAYAARGIGGLGASLPLREALRADAARLLGLPAAQLALTGGATRAIVDLAVNLRWRRGDRVLLFSGEFPANITPWQQAAQAEGLALEFLPAGDFWGGAGLGLAAVEDALRRGGVRLIAVSAVQFSTGLAMPLAELAALAHAHGALIAVDAIQALGALPLDAGALDLDMVVTGAHKWLMGMEGAGFCGLSARALEALAPRTAGWLSHEEPVRFLLEGAGHLRYDRPIRADASWMEGGAPPVLGFAALQAGMAPLLELGIPAIAAHIGAYLDRLEPALQARGFVSLRSPLAAQRSGILSVDPPPGVDPVALHAALGARGLACALPDGRLRLSPHWPNALGEIDGVLDVVDDALAALAPPRPGPAARSAPAAQRNRGPLLGVLARHLGPRGRLLELACGTGEHATFLARHLPGWSVLPTDPTEGARASAAAWSAWAAAPGLRPPAALDARDPDWGEDALDAVLCVNMTHISPWEATLGLLAGAGRHLRPGGHLFIYGPFWEDGVAPAPSNLDFDADLRRRDPAWGLRAVEALSAAAAAAGLRLVERAAMPANNLTLVLVRGA